MVVHLDLRRVRRLADLAVKPCLAGSILLPLVGGRPVLLLLLRAAVDPVLQAVEVDELAGAAALAGRDERILLGLALVQANSAGGRRVVGDRPVLHFLGSYLVRVPC